MRGESRRRCSKCVDGGRIVKNGKTKKGIQRYKCQICLKTFVEEYSYQAYGNGINNQIKLFVKEGLGIRSISRLLNISPKTVLSRIKHISIQLKTPIQASNKIYELDELCTYVGYKKRRIWVAYSIRRDTKEVIGFTVGNRTHKTLKVLIDRLLILKPKRVFIDKLKAYKYLIPKLIHKTKRYGTNHIERMNLNLRTHLKRLNRKTICFQKVQPCWSLV